MTVNVQFVYAGTSQKYLNKFDPISPSFTKDIMLRQFFRNFLSQNLTSGPVLKGVSQYPILNSESKLAFLLAAVGTRWRPEIIVGAIPDPHSQIWRGCCCKLPPAAQLKWKRIQVPKGMEGTKSIPSREPNISHPSPAGTFEDVFSFHKVGYVSSQACNREGEYSDSLHENVKNLFLLFSLQGTNISPTNSTFEDDFLFPQVGYVSSLEGRGFWQHPNHWHQWVSLLS